MRKTRNILAPIVFFLAIFYPYISHAGQEIARGGGGGREGGGGRGEQFHGGGSHEGSQQHRGSQQNYHPNENRGEGYHPNQGYHHNGETNVFEGGGSNWGYPEVDPGYSDPDEDQWINEQQQ